MKNYIFLFVIILGFMSCSKSNDDLPNIIGKWNGMEIQTTTTDQIVTYEVTIDFELDFKENGEFKAYMMGENQSGTWKLTNDSKKLILTASQESPAEFKILKLTKNELALKLGLGAFLMVKSFNKN